MITNVTNTTKLAIYCGKNIEEKNAINPTIIPIIPPQTGKKCMFLAMVSRLKLYAFGIGIIVKKERIPIKGSKNI